jgi:hypothetical protein
VHKPLRFSQGKPSSISAQAQMRKQGQSHPAIQPKIATTPQKPKLPSAPPVYRPQPVPKVLQTKTTTNHHSQKPQSGHQPVAPPAYRPQPTPKVLQVKTAARQQPPSPQLKNSPAAPPVYRPQPAPRVLQAKTAVARGSGTIPGRAPVAPPVYRPQPVPHVLQLKSRAMAAGTNSTRRQGTSQPAPPASRPVAAPVNRAPAAARPSAIQPKIGFEFEIRIPVWHEDRQLKPKEDCLKKAAGYKWEVDTNNKMTTLLNAAHVQGELQGVKPIYNGGIIEMVTTEEIDEWDDDADQQIETLVGRMASEAKQLERAIKFQPGQMRAIDLPGMPKAHIGFDTTHQPLIDHVNATAYVQATVAARIDRVEELMEVAKALDSPHALDAQRRTTILSEAPLNATKILNDLQDIHAGWLEQSASTPKQTVSPTPIASGFTFGSTPSSDTSQSTGGFTFGNSNATGSGGFTAPQSTSGGFSFGGFTPQSGSSGGFTFGNSNSSSSSGFLAPSIPLSGFTPPSSSNFQFGVSSWQDSHLDTLKSIPDVRQLSDLRGFLSVLSLVVLGSRTYGGTQVKNQSPLFNKCDLTKVRSSSLSSKSQAVLSRYADSIINLVLGVNDVDAEEDFERNNIMASVGQVVKSIVKGNSDAMFTLIAMGNDLQELQPERVGAKWLGQSNRPQSPVFEFRSIAGRPSPDEWVSLAKRIKDNVKAINQPKFQTRLEEDSFKRRTYPW